MVSSIRPSRPPRLLLLAAVCASIGAAQPPVGFDADVLPAAARASLHASLDDAAILSRHVWRDTPPASDRLVTAYVEIPRGDRRKWEFDMRAHRRVIDRMMPLDLGGYPANYGFVPQTVSYDGDPFDALVLGPPLAGGELVAGVIVGLFLMDDEKGPDAKVVLSPPSPDGQARYELDDPDRDRIAEYFARYKRHEPDMTSTVRGWGSVEDGLAAVRRAHAFFNDCRPRTPTACRIPPPRP